GGAASLLVCAFLSNVEWDYRAPVNDKQRGRLVGHWIGPEHCKGVPVVMNDSRLQPSQEQAPVAQAEVHPDAPPQSSDGPSKPVPGAGVEGRPTWVRYQ